MISVILDSIYLLSSLESSDIYKYFLRILIICSVELTALNLQFPNRM